MFGRATIRLGIGPHSSCIRMMFSYSTENFLAVLQLKIISPVERNVLFARRLLPSSFVHRTFLVPTRNPHPPLLVPRDDGCISRVRRTAAANCARQR